MATFFTSLLLIVGAIGGLAFVAGFVLRLISDEYDDLDVLSNFFMYGGFGVEALCAALTWFFLDGVDVAATTFLLVVSYPHLIFGIGGLIMFFIAFLWRIGAGGSMVEERTINTWTIALFGGIVIGIASLIMGLFAGEAMAL
jgi:hypothetical protein